MTLEVVVYNIESALKAQEGGADRIELCDNPSEGGTTPSYGMIKVAKEKLSIPVFVMIRPRGGDFNYSSEEFACMKADIIECKKLNVDGIVFGLLRADGHLDKLRCQALIDLARPMKVTCHRAFDMTRNAFETLEDCIEVGFDRILTSGHRAKAVEGISILKELIKKSAGRIYIMPGSGVNEENAAQLVYKTGARELHFSAVKYRNSEMAYKNEALTSMGTNQGNEFTLRSVDPTIVRTIRVLSEEAEVNIDT